MKSVDAGSWNERYARHLLNRAGFGIPMARVQALAGMTPDAAVGSLVDAVSPAPKTAPEFLLSPITRSDLKKMHPDATDPELQLIYQERQREERTAVSRLQRWWLERMYAGDFPLEEKMTLFWHGHFASSAQKVRSSYLNYHYYETMRTRALGNVKGLAIAVGQTPAMLEYLDNRKSTKESPNENWARELMELFTLGQGQYTEADIKESARAFTGWTCDRLNFRYDLSRHDDGEKTFLGRTGHFDGWDVMDILFEQPAASCFIAGKVWAYFAGEVEDAATVEALAATLRENNFEMRPMLRQLFLSEAFYSDRVIATQIKSPAQYVLQLCHDMNVPPPYEELPRAMRLLGQDLFHPPNVKGWDGNRAWINANSLLIRFNLSAALTGSAAAQGGGGEDDMMMMGAQMSTKKKPATVAPTAAEKKAYGAQVKAEIRTLLHALPPNERAARQTELKAADKKQRPRLLKALGVSDPPWKQPAPARIFDAMQFETAGACADALLARFFVAPPGAAQRSAVLAAMGAADAAQPLTPKQLDTRTRLAVVRLITSMTEYQLC